MTWVIDNFFNCKSIIYSKHYRNTLIKIGFMLRGDSPKVYVLLIVK